MKKKKKTTTDINVSGVQVCSHCNEVKFLFEFTKHRRTPSGARRMCKECDRTSGLARDFFKEKDGEGLDINASGLRRCNLCEEFKFLFEFNKSYRGLHGVFNTCRQCDSKRKALHHKKFPHQGYARVAKRRATQLNATPKWSDLEAIRRIYKEAKELCEKTGEEYHVDHIIPLKSKIVCGLHVPENLRIIPASENLSKGNRLKDLDKLLPPVPREVEWKGEWVAEN